MLRHSNIHNRINWQNPIVWEHPLNVGTAAWWLVTPHGQGGTVWRDLTGRHHGTLENMDPATNWVRSDRRGGFGALDFDGNNDTVIVPSDAALKPGIGDMTWSFWTKADIAGDRPDFISDRPLGAAGAQEGYYFGHGGFPTDGLMEVFIEVSDHSYKKYERVGYYTVAEGWFYTVVTWSNISDTLIIYKNGIDVTSLFTKANDDNLSGKDCSNTENLSIIGRPGAADGRTLDGRMDDVHIWDRPLSAPEVAQYFELSQIGYPGIFRRVVIPFYSQAGVAPSIGTPYYYDRRQRMAS